MLEHMNKDLVVETEATEAASSEPEVSFEAGASKVKRLHTSQSSGMDNSILRFQDINFTCGNGDKLQHILRDVNGTVKWGHVLAILGPSGAGKTTLINALTLDAHFGKPSGSVTLNGVPMTDHIFKTHCYVVVQQDKHWPLLTCRETLKYAAELYDVALRCDIDTLVDEILDKMGLRICADTRNARLSGGQARRLSIGVALLKQPTVLFLDEPTTGLDAAAAENIMQEIVEVAKRERLIILCTIHQPSTKVYNGFDQVMILSKGREAFTGDVHDAIPYFESIGYPLPEMTNPAEHFLDLVNSDFSNDAEVDDILATWEERRTGAGNSNHKQSGSSDEVHGQIGVSKVKRAPLLKEIAIMFRRQSSIMIRDPILYVGRAAVFLVSNIIFAVVYLQARKYNQEQALNKMWINIWFVGVPGNMGVVAVYGLNEEFKSILRETKNGMVGPLSYVLAKSILLIPIMFVFAIAALGIPAIAIMDFPVSSFGMAILLWACLLFVFECIAECLSVWFEDPILGMMNFMNFWFGAFLFGGFLISENDMYWPFRFFYYVMPIGYYLRSSMYNFLIDTTFGPCTEDTVICVDTPATGQKILEAMSVVYPVIEAKDTAAKDIGIMLAIALFYKILYLVGVFRKARMVAKINPAKKFA